MAISNGFWPLNLSVHSLVLREIVPMTTGEGVTAKLQLPPTATVLMAKREAESELGPSAWLRSRSGGPRRALSIRSRAVEASSQEAELC